MDEWIEKIEHDYNQELLQLKNEKEQEEAMRDNHAIPFVRAESKYVKIVAVKCIREVADVYYLCS